MSNPSTGTMSAEGHNPGRDTDPSRRRLQALSFGAAANAYDRGRPPYPDEAINWMLPPGARQVLDLGAGTGKLTRQLVERGLEVTAVDPIAEMRTVLQGAVPAATILDGAAEAVPLPDRSVDAVLVAQAWHWVDPVRAVPEVARVLRPGGCLGLVWNHRDETVPWLAELGRMMEESEEDSGAVGDDSDATIGPPFLAVEEFIVKWVHTVAAESLLDMVASRSYVILMPDDERASLLDRVRNLVTSHPDLAGVERIAVPFVTKAFRARLPLSG